MPMRACLGSSRVPFYARVSLGCFFIAVHSTPLFAQMARCPAEVVRAQDLRQGTGVTASPSGVAMVRVAAWGVNPNVSDFKGPLLSVDDFAFDFSVLTAARGGARGTVSRGIMDLITAAPLLPPMRVGGKRTAIVHCVRRIEVELFDFAPAAAQLRLTKNDLPPPPAEQVAVWAQNPAKAAPPPAPTAQPVPRAGAVLIPPTSAAPSKAVIPGSDLGFFQGAIRGIPVSLTMMPAGSYASALQGQCKSTMRIVSADPAQHKYLFRQGPERGVFVPNCKDGDLAVTIQQSHAFVFGVFMAARIEGALERKESPEWLSWDTFALPQTPEWFEFGKTLDSGQGAEIVAGQFTLLRITNYAYNANATNFAGKLESNEIKTLRADQFPAASGLRKGGKRLVVSTWQAKASKVFVVELLEVSPQPEDLQAMAARMEKNGHKTDEEIRSAPKWFEVLARACTKGCVARNVSGADRNSAEEANSFQQLSSSMNFATEAKPANKVGMDAIAAARNRLSNQVLTCGSSVFLYETASLLGALTSKVLGEKYFSISQVKKSFWASAESVPVTPADVENGIRAKRDVYLFGSPYRTIQPDPETPWVSQFHDNSGHLLKLSMILRDGNWQFDLPSRHNIDFTCEQISFLWK